MIDRNSGWHAALGSAALLAALVQGGSPAVAETAPDEAFAVPADTAAAITEVMEAWSDAYVRGEAEALAALFTEDGLYAANTGEVLRGRAGIRDGVRSWNKRQVMFLEALGFPADSRIDLDEDVVRFRAAGDAVYRLSRFMILVEPSRCAMDAGHALAIWREQAGGEWRIESLVVNRDRTPPEEACGRRPE